MKIEVILLRQCQLRLQKPTLSPEGVLPLEARQCFREEVTQLGILRTYGGKTAKGGML